MEEAIGKALKLLEEWDKGYQEWVEETRQKVDVALEQIERGEGIDGELVFERLREKLSVNRLFVVIHTILSSLVKVTQV